MAVNSSLLETSIDGARGILLNISGGDDLSLFEVNEVAQIVNAAADPEANIIFGAVVDPSLGDSIWVTVVAAGFDTTGEEALVEQVESPHAFDRPVDRPVERSAGRPFSDASGNHAAGTASRTEEPEGKDLEVPSFLRLLDE